jgi:metal-responsive CopG/Arc/MetJ family transcriptional regulator
MKRDFDMIEKTRVHLNIPSDLVKQIDELATKTFQTRTQWIIQAIVKNTTEDKNDLKEEK